MRVLAARFKGPLEARAVLDVLQRRLSISERDAAVAPLGIPGQGDSDDAVLAGRFPDESVALVAEFIRAAGGEIVANVDEARTKPRPPRPAYGSRGTTAQCQMSGRAS